ncbi:MAG: 6-carboxytetrahydropterin synthase [Bacteroidetes bacterium]|nr:6-carboxytetrahydropterin synthase [Bacteroidota bacterium]
MVKICKEFKWEMGHRLIEHNLCSNPHGHSYRMQVILESEETENGMVLDYYILGNIVRDIIENFDHSFAVSEKDNLLKSFLEQNNFKMVVLPFDATAENLCYFLGSIIKEKLQPYKNIKILTIRLYETRSVYAERSFPIT